MTDTDDADVPPLEPSRERTAPSRGILRAAAPPANDSLWTAREWLYQVNSRLAQKNVAVKVPVPEGNVLGNVFRRWQRRQGQADGPFEQDDVLADTLRRVHFRTEDLTHTYPISRTLAPGEEAKTRERIESEAHARAERLCGRPWSARELESLYRVCCRAREDVPEPSIMRVFHQAETWPTARVRTLDFSGTPLAQHAVPLADMLCAPTGVQALLFDQCSLSTDAVAAIVSAVFLGQTVHTLSLANNAIQTHGWHAVSGLMKNHRTLRHLDVSYNTLSKASLRILLTPLGLRQSSLHSLRLDQCGLRSAHLDLIAHAVYASSLLHFSLRRNDLSDASALAISRILMDWDEDARGAIEDVERVGMVPVSTSEDLYGSEDQTTVVQSLLRGEDAPHSQARHDLRQLIIARAQAFQHALSEIPCHGHLLTLDLKDNALHDADAGILATALRRNRTLRVLSLADNNISHHGLAALAEALRYNTTLETLDLAFNACCGPELDGVLRLRVALAVHPRLKRIVLAHTQLAAEGALALVECLPDAEHVVHLDLTDNPIGLVGMMGLAAGMRQNTSIRCMDVSLYDSPEFVDAAHEVYNICASNTQRAQDQAPQGVRIQRPLDKSALARALHESERESQVASETEPSEYSEAPDDESSGGESREAPDAKSSSDSADDPLDLPAPATAAQNDRADSLLDEEGAVFRAAHAQPDAPNDQPSEQLREALLEVAHTE